jgi:excinuclease ABC subunit A
LKSTAYSSPIRRTGLHVERLISILHRLVDAGHSVLVIEHNLDLVAAAHWVLDLGPEGGDAGGNIIAEGPPARLAGVQSSYRGAALRRYLDSPGSERPAHAGIHLRMLL